MTEKEMQVLETNYIEVCSPHGKPNLSVLKASILYLQGLELPPMSDADRETFERMALPYCKALLNQQQERGAQNEKK